MRVLDRGDQLRKELDAARAAGRSVGLVPTMGALHEGHASLIRRSAAECDVTAVTVFVNPLQFGPSEDLDTYPRDLAADVARGRRRPAPSVLFAPPVDDMYPDGPPGGHRPRGRRRRAGRAPAGPATSTAWPPSWPSCSTWPARAGPTSARRTGSSCGVVRRLAADLSFPVEVVGCPTVREADGLACSSRNVSLSPEERAAATVLYRALDHRGHRRGRRRVATSAGSWPTWWPRSPSPPSTTPRSLPDRLLIAARFGSVRLIDNME